MQGICCVPANILVVFVHNWRLSYSILVQVVKCTSKDNQTGNNGVSHNKRWPHALVAELSQRNVTPERNVMPKWRRANDKLPLQMKRKSRKRSERGRRAGKIRVDTGIS